MTSTKSLLRRDPSRYDATALFCDIRGFSELFDEKDPMDVLNFVNQVLGELGNVVEASNGCIDKFTGDGFLAHFGVLVPSENHAREACECALRMRDTLNRLNISRHEGFLQTISVGIGIHTGLLAGGVVSSFSKSEFSVFGDVVNMASRIESLTKEFAVDCLVSEAVYQKTHNFFDFQKMPFRTMKGVRQPQLTYWLLPTNMFLAEEKI